MNPSGSTVPAPANLRLLNGRSEGRDSGGRVVEPPPPFRRIAPNPPTYLSREARAEWRRIVPELTRLELVKQPDRAALVAYCECWSRLVEALRLIRTRGITATTSQGEGVAPWVRVAETAGKELRGWAQEFGLTPSAEGRLKANAPSGETDAGDDLFG